MGPSHTFLLSTLPLWSHACRPRVGAGSALPAPLRHTFSSYLQIPRGLWSKSCACSTQPLARGGSSCGATTSRSRGLQEELRSLCIDVARRSWKACWTPRAPHADGSRATATSLRRADGRKCERLGRCARASSRGKQVEEDEHSAGDAAPERHDCCLSRWHLEAAQRKRATRPYSRSDAARNSLYLQRQPSSWQSTPPNEQDDKVVLGVPAAGAHQGGRRHSVGYIRTRLLRSDSRRIGELRVCHTLQASWSLVSRTFHLARLPSWLALQTLCCGPSTLTADDYTDPFSRLDPWASSAPRQPRRVPGTMRDGLDPAA